VGLSRIGQANQTHLTRFVVRGTVDDRLLGKPTKMKTYMIKRREILTTYAGMQAEKSKVYAHPYKKNNYTTVRKTDISN